MPSNRLRQIFGFSRPATIPAGGGAGSEPGNAILYPDVLTQETWEKRKPLVVKAFGDFGMGETLKAIQAKFQELGLDRDLPSIDAELARPEAFLEHLGRIKATTDNRPLFVLLDPATDRAARLGEAISKSSLAISTSGTPVTDVINALLDLKRRVSERDEVIDRMPDEFRRKLEQDPVFKSMKTVCESISLKNRQLIDAIGQVRRNPTAAQVREKFQEGSNPARDIISTVTFWNQRVVGRWPKLSEQVFSDIRSECIGEALSYASSLKMTGDLSARARERQEKVDAIEQIRTELETEARAVEEKENLARQELSDAEKSATQKKSAAADEFLLKVGPDYTRAQYREKIEKIDAAAGPSIKSRSDDIRTLNEKIAKLRALAEGKKREIEDFEALGKTEVLDQMDKLQESLAGVTSLVSGYERFWGMLNGQISS
jgi:hypothetical protein